MKNVVGMKAKASITVEAAFIVPLVLMTVFLLISLDFFVHDRAYYTLCAYETALTGNGFRHISETAGEDSAKEKISSLRKSHRMPTKLPDGSVNLRKEKTEAAFEGSVYQLWGTGVWNYKVGGSVLKINPEETIRKIRTAENILP